jgi:two-component system, chemotaxis family, response regulator WspF
VRIAIVNDLKMAVEILRRVVASVPGYDIAWTAYDGAEAVEKCRRDTPDLILMDLIMPVMDGVESTRQIMKQCPCIILVVTATVEGNASKVFDAMGHGALDAVNTPALGTGGDLEGASDLLVKMARLSILINRPEMGKRARTEPSLLQGLQKAVPNLTVVGSSTGGPKALAEILAVLPPDFNGSILIAQHVDKQFAPGMASWLDTQTTVPVSLAVEGRRVAPGQVLLAATNDHLMMTPDLKLRYSAEPRDYPYRPSVNVLFQSVARCWPVKGTAVLLTGMGHDGAEGMRALRNTGWHTIAQDEKSCVVYGMPKAAAEMDAVDRFMPPLDIGNVIKNLTKQ